MLDMNEMKQKSKLSTDNLELQEEFEDIKEIIIICKSKKDRHNND